MDSRSFQNEPCSSGDDEEEEFYSIRTRQRTATKQIKRKNITTRKPADETELHLESTLLGEVGLTAEEFSTLRNSERKQLLEAVLQSKEEYKILERKAKSEQLDMHSDTSAHKKSANCIPVTVKCSIPLHKVVIDTDITCNVRPNLNKFRPKRPPEVTAEDEVHMETTSSAFKKIKFNENCLAESEADIDELVSCDELSSTGAEKCELAADKSKLGVADFSEKPEDLGLRDKDYCQDCAGVQEVNSLHLLTSETNVQLRHRNGERSSTERETSCRCLLLEIDDNSQMSAPEVCASLGKAETTEEKLLNCPNSPASCQLIRKYRVQATDNRPLFKQFGLDLKARVRVIYDYYTACEIRRYESYCKITSSTQWGKPIAIEMDTSKASTRNLRPRGGTTETELTNDKSLHKSGNQTSDCDVYNALINENEKVRKRLVLPVKQFPRSTASSESLDVDLELDDLWTHEDIDPCLRKSRQTKIGGGLVEDEGAKIPRRKAPKRSLNSPASDDENDPDFVPDNKKKRIHVDNERSQKSEKSKKRRLGLVKSTGKHLRKTEEQIPESSKAAEWNEIGSDDGEGEASRNLAKGSIWQATTAPKCNANNSHTHSSTSPEDFSVTRSAMEEHQFFSNTLMSSNTVNHGDLDQCQINADLESGLSSPQVSGINSAFKNDAKQQVFPVFQKLVRPCLREDERNIDTRNNPSTSRNSNSKQDDENEVLSGDSSEGDDCNVDKSTKKTKHGGQHSTFTKTYQKKKAKNVEDQQKIISFATPSYRIPKVTQMCPLCQKDFPMSSLEEHVQKCVQLDDERKVIR